MVEEDNVISRGKADHVIGADLSAVSVDELRERILRLEAEIDRLKAEVARKEASRNDAASFFRL